MTTTESKPRKTLEEKRAELDRQIKLRDLASKAHERMVAAKRSLAAKRYDHAEAAAKEAAALFAEMKAIVT